MTYRLERQKAVEAVIQASRLCRTVQAGRGVGGALGKEDGSPVTVADFGAQALIALHLSEAFPGDPIVGEEQSKVLREDRSAATRTEVIRLVRTFHPSLDSEAVLDAVDLGAGKDLSRGRFWTVDPVDGTRGFIRGDQYAVALALIEDGRVVLGVMGCPNLPLSGRETANDPGSLFVAVKGEGAVMRGLEAPGERKIRVAGLEDPSLALICESLESDHASHDSSARVAQSLGISKKTFRMDSQCKYGMVARGDATAYLRITTDRGYVEKIWDHAAGALIVEEAGGRVTDLDGKILKFTGGRGLPENRGIIASNGKIHGALLEAVRRLGL